MNKRWCWNHLLGDIENALKYGWNRAHKHTEAPTMDQIIEEQLSEVENAIAEAITEDEEA
jgi:hypothetical protein